MNKIPPYQSKRKMNILHIRHVKTKNSESDINIDDTQHQENPHTPETLQIHNIYNTTMHDKI